MIIDPGTRLGPYEVVSRLGAGGMGEVWRARDTRLDRSVAIKVLPAEFAQNAQLKIRFEREAKTISQLQHPHICTLFDVGESDGASGADVAPADHDERMAPPLPPERISYLVMELLEGETLADRLARGALSLSEVLKYGAQIADALDRAHRAGVIHRDLKPANVMITKSGAKLLDFGLAKSGTAVVEIDGATVQKQLTQEGTILGTFQYMAPEQLEGEDADARTDIFALGAVLYEMLTGKRAFEGKTRTSLIAAIVDRQPAPASSIQPLTPPALEHVISKCLEKDPDDRWQSAHDVAEELRWVSEAGSQAGIAAPLVQRKKTRERLLIATAIVASLAAGVSTWISWRLTRQQRPVLRLAVPFPPKSILWGTGMPNIALSPDGNRVVFSAYRDAPQLYSRALNSFELSLLDGTVGAEGPFFSPDGEWVGFFVPGALKKVRLVSGGAPITVGATTGSARGGTWGTDGFIYFSAGSSSGLSRISADGGRPETLTKPDAARGENSHRWPQLLPDGKHLLFTIRTDRITSFDEAKIAVVSLETKKWRVVLEGGSHATYLTTGHLIFSQRGSLFAVPFDLDSLSVNGSPRPVVQGILRSESSGAAQYSIAEGAGTLAYVSASGEFAGSTLVKLDRSGQEIQSFTLPRRIDPFRVSPDGRRIVAQVPAANDDIWISDLDRGTFTRISFEPGDEWHPTWSSDGSKVVFGSARALFMGSVDGAEAPRVLVQGMRIARAPSCSRDGKSIAFAAVSETTGADLWLLSLVDGNVAPLLQTPSSEMDPAFSPDDRWIAYISNAAGRPEVYLRRMDGGGQWQISNDGGFAPRWSRDGREIFYRFADKFYAAPVGLGSTPTIGKPRILFERQDVDAYDVVHDGFLISRNSEGIMSATSVNLVLGWTDELRRSARAN